MILLGLSCLSLGEVIAIADFVDVYLTHDNYKQEYILLYV